MKTADLYIRVSTDEQADKGYSQRSQEELLRKYCDINHIAIGKVMFEDHSAKTFERPQWKSYLLELRKHKSKSDFVLFLKWDRFSRNAGDAYQMINTLRKLGIEPQAIEQPLDLTIPENKMMLAFYLAAPEVENDRRALNVIHGMRRARKEGRYMGLAPVGYINKTDEAGRKHIAINEPQASILRWSFEEIAKSIYNTEQIYKLAKKKGFKGTKSLFWFAIRNPVYCGKIFIAKYKDDESRFVKGQHEPIISENLYYQVQDILDGRKREPYKLKVVSNAELPLRGFLICPKCGRLLTGSQSKGLTKRYTYYHCSSGCNYRHRADEINNQLVNELKKYIPSEKIAEVYKITLQEAWHNKTDHLQEDRRQLLKEIQEFEGKLVYIRELLSSKQIEPEDFREMKSDYRMKIERLEAKLSGLTHNYSDLNVEDLIDKGINALLQLDHIYEVAEMDKKRDIISSMFPEKLHFENNSLRTGRVNEAVKHIYMANKALALNKKGQSRIKSTLSCEVGMTRFELATPRPPDVCATGLRYIPKRFKNTT
jgi:site-specific DNA recombinase